MSRNERLGIFILGALAILGVGIFLIGREQGLFTTGYALKAAFTNVAGLQNGAEVRVGGINEGSVQVIQLPTTPDQKVMVVMRLRNNTRNVIRKNSTTSIHSEGLVGAEYVSISFGTTDSPPVQDGETLQGEPPIDFSDLLKKTNTILDSTQSMTSNLSTASENLAAISAKINGGKGSLGELVNNKQMYNELNATTAQAAAGAAAFKDNMEALHHNFLLRGFFNKRGYSDATELTAHATDTLPQQAYTKRFSFDARQLFDKPGSPKLKSAKSLDEAGNYLQSNKFGMAVIVAYTGAEGDSEKDKTLTEARSMLVRDYLVKHFRIMNDPMLKTMGVGKDAPSGTPDDGGVEILIYPEGAGAPAAKSPVLSSQQ